MKRIFAVMTAMMALVSGIMVKAYAQDSVREVLDKSESLRKEYRFSEAAQICEKALEERTMVPENIDSLAMARIEESLIMARNGENMLRYCSTPKVVAKRLYPIDEFFLWYPFEDGSWRQTPNVFDKSAAFPYATYAPESSKELYFAAHDEDGQLSIYHSEATDSLWTAPILADEKLTSWSDESFPVLSADGRTLFFSSKGLYGVGGYDLYRSIWDSKEKAWGEPENLGFPYSSPYNDYLFMHSPDGRYSIFASDRECPGTNNVYIYVLEFDSMPVRKAITDPAEALKLCQLAVANDGKKTQATASETSENDETRRYVLQLRKVQSLKSRIADTQASIDAARGSLTSLDEDERKSLSSEIMERELAILSTRDSLNKATKDLQTIEMDLLMAGVVVDPRSVLQVSDSESASGGYIFTRHSFGKDLDIAFMKPVSSFDYSFMILPQGRFAEDNTLPDGLIYQIQIFSKTSGTAKESELKGLSPVFTRKDKSGKTVYCAGLFRTYNDALSNLNKVKRVGFKSAMIVALLDGESINVNTARQKEKTMVQNYRIRIRPENGRLSESELAAINAATSKDLSRETIDGAVTYLIGTFSDSAEVSTVLSALKAAGLPGVTMESVE